ncbi:glucokinase [Sphingomonas sp. LaA6.9]|uniref:glucokinase n=1 Tax=Sphingomonas sp. LaA6.9 TaxID=2919914 RepID=UPI001F4F832A|nr:glucokinase [Sphingomonas sp. LaA6.9]MCJ8156962.1 glucokinase [Sphingomonas sp. LaA6.9]
MTEIVAVDIGGTHARFALAEVDGGRVLHLSEPVTLKTAEHPSLQLAWEHFAAEVGRPLPDKAGIAVASPVGGEVIKLTNNPWIIRPSLIGERLGVSSYALVNDFGAVGHAVAQMGSEHFRHLSGPEVSLPDNGVISVVGPGTGLGVAQVLRRDGHYFVSETEGGHIDFAPLDRIEDAILDRLRKRYRRVSVERIVSGPGLVNIYEALAEIEGKAVHVPDDKTLWTTALAGTDSLASAALDRFCQCLGAAAGDFALAQGAQGVVIAGGLGLRIADTIHRSGFAERFRAKGRFESMMAAIPVKQITHPEPGLYGAAAAWAIGAHPS